ncbi:hypothetical protein [Neoaquamicrobium sediminum]|uniref:hypothetical protein n=1 Tax=Neoaquamicrobium sediminum TaxID=1849104 RepID=UPI001563507A|nr:hypothetical protein [Mesorhizobium sediminum]NRC57309.1 hypothetical protein [Mesorhizobium sediminum]
MVKKAPEFAVGDRIAYAAAFLRSTGQHSGKAPFMRATVTSVGPPVSSSAGAIITFRTDDGTESGGLACNFTLVSRIAVDAARRS